MEALAELAPHRAVPSNSGLLVLWDYGDEENDLQRTRAVGYTASA